MRKILALLILTSCSAFAQFTTTAKHITQGTALPATCSPLSGDIFFIKSGGGLGPYYCSAVNTWSAITGSSVGNAFSVLTGGTNITAAMVVGAGASLDFTSTGIINASKINGNPLGSTTPTTTNILIADGTNWITRTVSGDITISNTGVVAIGAAKVTNAMLAGSIDASTKFTNATPIANGGTGQATQQAGFDALAPTATVAGSIIYWNGTHWVKLDGNASGTNFLQENASGVPSWAAAGGGTPCTITALSFQFNNAGAFGCATALTYVAGTNTLLGSSSLNVDFSAAASVSLPAVFLRSDTAFTMTAGQAIIANPSATTAGFRITVATLPSTQGAGDFFCDASSNCGWSNGTTARTIVAFLGSGTAYGTAPTAGKCVEWSTNYQIVVAASNTACGSGGAPANYYTSTTKTGIGDASFTPTHPFDVSGALVSNVLVSFINSGSAKHLDFQVDNGGQTYIQYSGTGLQLLDGSSTGVRAFTGLGVTFYIGGIQQGTFITDGHYEAAGTSPTINSGFGTSPSIAGQDSGGRVTVGTGGAASGVISFHTTWTNAPACSTFDETTAQAMRPTASTTTLTITGTMSASDKVVWHCIGY